MHQELCKQSTFKSTFDAVAHQKECSCLPMYKFLLASHSEKFQSTFFVNLPIVFQCFSEHTVVI